MKHFIIYSALLMVTLGSASVQGVTVYDSMPGGYTGNTDHITGDLWRFYCPKGGQFDLMVDTVNADAEAYAAGKSAVDPYFAVMDGAGILIWAGGSGATCTIPSANGSTVCPSITAKPCGVGARHYIGISGNNLSSGAGNYKLVLTVRDADGDTLLDKKIALGGGTRPRRPNFQQLDGLNPAPIVNDGEWRFPW